MILAVKTTASPAGLWAIVVVSVCAVAVWLFMVEVFAPRSSARLHRRVQPGPERDSRQAEAAGADRAEGPGPAEEPAMRTPGRGPGTGQEATTESAVASDDIRRRAARLDSAPGQPRPAG